MAGRALLREHQQLLVCVRLRVLAVLGAVGATRIAQHRTSCQLGCAACVCVTGVGTAGSSRAQLGV